MLFTFRSRDAATCAHRLCLGRNQNADEGYLRSRVHDIYVFQDVPEADATAGHVRLEFVLQSCAHVKRDTL